MRAPFAIAAALAFLLTGIAGRPTASAAQDSWDPFKYRREQTPAGQRPRATEAVRPAPPPASPTPDDVPTPQRIQRPDSVSRVDTAPRYDAHPVSAGGPPPRGDRVEKTDLDPIMAPDSSGLPLDLWRGLDLNGLETLLARLDLPPKSATLHALWRRMLLSAASPPAGAPEPDHFLALRLEALYRSGLLTEMDDITRDAGTRGPLIEALLARRDIGLGRRAEGCRVIAALAKPSSGLPGRLKGETQLLAGYCAAAARDLAGAGLAANLAREEGLTAELPLAILTAVSAEEAPQLRLPARILLLDYRFLELMGPVNVAQVLDRAEPALLTVLMQEETAEPRLRVMAAEAALRAHAVSPEAVAEVYRRQTFAASGDDPQRRGGDPALNRALYFRAIDAARTAPEKLRMAHALLGDARRVGLNVPIARMLGPVLGPIPPAPELDAYAETAIEVLLLSEQFERARRWAEAAGLQPWIGLIDLADTSHREGRLASLAPMEQLAQRGRLSPETLHRLSTVIDALDIEVPMGLWDAAGRTPQPAAGYLPETGVLAELAEAAKRKDAGRTILLVMRALGPVGPDGANLLSIGDAVRALCRIGLDADARRLAVEALLPGWPRFIGN